MKRLYYECLAIIIDDLEMFKDHFVPEDNYYKDYRSCLISLAISASSYRCFAFLYDFCDPRKFPYDGTLYSVVQTASLEIIDFLYVRGDICEEILCECYDQAVKEGRKDIMEYVKQRCDITNEEFIEYEDEDEGQVFIECEDEGQEFIDKISTMYNEWIMESQVFGSHYQWLPREAMTESLLMMLVAYDNEYNDGLLYAIGFTRNMEKRD